MAEQYKLQYKSEVAKELTYHAQKKTTTDYASSDHYLTCQWEEIAETRIYNPLHNLSQVLDQSTSLIGEQTTQAQRSDTIWKRQCGLMQ